MIITYIGHAAFLIVTHNGTRIITDPYNAGQYGDSFRYKAIVEPADIVTISHDHSDHNFDGIEGEPCYVREIGHRVLDSVVIDGYPSYHDDCQGMKRGENRIYAIRADGLTVLHLGDLGHSLSEEQTRQFGKVDVLLIPVGGTYTIDAKTAWEVVGLIKPAIVIPMHYLTDRCSFPIRPVDDFIRDADHEKRPGPLEVDPANLPGATACYVLEPTH
jgi:L-ascorbate metabolism protein UlaG (beta-lactamase superfamily)